MNQMYVSKILSALAAGSLIFVSTVQGQDRVPVRSLNAVAIGPQDSNGPGNLQTGSVTIVIERWTDSSSQSSGASDAGFIRSGHRILARLVAAREEIDRKTNDRRIFIETDKPVSQWRITQGLTTDAASTMPVESTAFDIRLSEFGTGEGRLREGNAAGMGTIRLAAISTDYNDQDRH